MQLFCFLAGGDGKRAAKDGEYFLDVLRPFASTLDAVRASASREMPLGALREAGDSTSSSSSSGAHMASEARAPAAAAAARRLPTSSLRCESRPRRGARRRRPLARNLLPPLSIKTGGWVGPASVR